MRTNVRGVLAGWGVVLVAMSMQCAALGRAASPLLVTPARYRSVQLGQDLARIGSVTLLSYQGDRNSETPLLHLWTGDAWQPVGLEEYISGSVAGASARPLILVGDQGELPKVLADSAHWAGHVERVTSLAAGDTVKVVHKLRPFTAGELAWLAGRYDLEVLDTNWERRRYGRYGRDGAGIKPEPPPAPLTTPAAAPSVFEPPVKADVQQQPAPPPAAPQLREAIEMRDKLGKPAEKPAEPPPVSAAPTIKGIPPPEPKLDMPAPIPPPPKPVRPSPPDAGPAETK